MSQRAPFPKFWTDRDGSVASLVKAFAAEMARLRPRATTKRSLRKKVRIDDPEQVELARQLERERRIPILIWRLHNVALPAMRHARTAARLHPDAARRAELLRDARMGRAQGCDVCGPISDVESED